MHIPQTGLRPHTCLSNAESSACPTSASQRLFNALTKAGIAAENYPFCTIEPNVGIVEVPDARLAQLVAIAKPQKTIPAVVEFVDIAGLVAGASKGEGLGNKFLANIRETDAIAHVVRCFVDDNVVHVAGKIDPLSDIETINTELALADLATVEKTMARYAKVGEVGRQGSAAHHGGAGKGAAGAESGEARAQPGAVARGTAGAAAAVPDDGQAGDVRRQRRRKRLQRQPAARAGAGIRQGGGRAGGRDLRRDRGADGRPGRRGQADIPRRHGGVLLHGPPGTGKTLIARAVAGETDANFISISGPEIVSKFYGESEQRLRQIFEEASKTAPSIIFIDEIDSIAPKREEVSGDLERRVVAQLLALMDGLSSRGEVIVIAATNRPNALDPAIRRGGRFDREIEIGIPNKNGRLEVLYVHTRGMPLDESLDLKEIADSTHGFVGADLYSLCKEAAMRTLERALPDLDVQEDIPLLVLENLRVTKEDFRAALKKIEPSAMREVFVEVAEVHWNEVGGLEEAKQSLVEAVEWPLKYPEAFASVGVRPPRGILLYGLPGTGKTLLVRALATESNVNFISVKGPELLSKWVGESERAVREIFRKARQAAPALVFFDEIDSVIPARGSGSDSMVTERVVSQFLTEMDGLVELKDVVIIAATNRPDLLDSSMLRPGRFDRLIYIPMPDRDARKRILEIHLSRMAVSEVSAPWLAENTEDFSGADLEMLCREAGMLALRKHIRPGMSREELIIDKIMVTKEHFQEAIARIKPHLSKDILEEYSRMIRGFNA